MSALEQLRTKPVLVYGAGAIARVILPYLLYNEGIKLVGVAVTQGVETADIGTQDIPVKLIDDLTDQAREATILIATSEQYHEEIQKICRERGFENVVPLTSSLKDKIIISHYQKYFAGKGISLGGSEFQLKGMRFLNPLRLDVPNGVNLFSQLGDLVLPNAYNDWRMVVEGPYDCDWGPLIPGSVVLDCGANFGVFSVYAASKGCTVYAFEPTPSLHPILRRHTEMNGGRINLEPFAISNKMGQAVFHLDPYSCGGSSLLVRSANTVEMSVQQITIDEFVRLRGLERVDFIKADIEGAERLMLEGAKETLAEFSPKLSVCTYHLPDDKEVLTQLIMNANPNYKIKYQWQKLYAHV